jgi:hypothetical protein
MLGNETPRYPSNHARPLTSQPKGGIGDHILKPKGMHLSTFERAIERINGAEEIVARRAVLMISHLPPVRKKKQLGMKAFESVY